MSQFFKVLRKAIEKRDCHKLRISLALSLCIAGFFAVLKLAIPPETVENAKRGQSLNCE
jgi:hypothetical protein